MDERAAFWRGYKDYATCAAQRRLGMAQAFDSLYSPIWRPPQGFEEEYTAGWETARARESEEQLRAA